MPPLRSRTVTGGRNMAGARALLRATGPTDDDFARPTVAIANNFTEVVPWHIHMREVADVVAKAVSGALRTCAAPTTSASTGAARDVSQVER